MDGAASPSVPPVFDDDWEEWSPEKGSFVHHMIAGSFAGVAEHVAMFPLDSYKTHQQVARSRAEAPLSFLSLVRQQGALRMWRGASAMFLACIPSHAAYFSVYEAAKELLGANEPGHHPLAAGAAGSFATMLHDAVLTPMDVVKQRLQLGFYTGVRNCVSTMWREEGLRAFYRSYPTTVLMNIPQAATIVAANESFKRILNPTGEYNAVAYLLSGAGAGALAAIATNPLDVLKTRLQTQNLTAVCSPEVPPLVHAKGMSASAKGIGVGGAAGKTPCGTVRVEATSATSAVSAASAARGSASGAASAASAAATAGAGGARVIPQYDGMVDAAKKLWAEGGSRAFFRGVKARVMVQVPSSAISWTTYEFVKKLIADTVDRK